MSLSSSVADVGPERTRWALETLAVEPRDRLLEIGGGPGVASLVCARLDRGSLLLIDRLATAIERSPPAELGARRIRAARPQHRGRGGLRPGKAHFDKAYAINVNVFWTTPVDRPDAAEVTCKRRRSR